MEGGFLMTEILFGATIVFILAFILLICGILIFNEKALFLIAGFDKEDWTQNQITYIARAVGRLCMSCAVICCVEGLVILLDLKGSEYYFTQIVAGICFIFEMWLVTYKAIHLKKVV